MTVLGGLKIKKKKIQWDMNYYKSCLTSFRSTFFGHKINENTGQHNLTEKCSHYILQFAAEEG